MSAFGGKAAVELTRIDLAQKNHNLLALKRFFGIARFLSKSVSLKPLGTKRPGQVSLRFKSLSRAREG